MFRCHAILYGAISGIITLYAFANSDPDFDIGNWEIVCELHFPDVFCTTSDKQFPETQIPTIPLNIIPEPEKVETITIDLTTPRKGRGRCLINDHKMFHPFTKVFDIQFVGVVTLSPSYQTKEREKLIDELFNLRRLENVRLENWKQGDNTWKFPNSIQNLQLIRHGYTKLDLSSYSNLRILLLSENNLNTIPKLSYPPPPLVTLDLSGNPDLEVRAFDIVELCRLHVLHLRDVNARINETAQQCECKMLKKFMKKCRIDGSHDLHCRPQKNCTGYDFEKLMNICEACNNGNKVGYDALIPDRENRHSSKLFWSLLVTCVVSLYAATITGYLIYDFIVR